MDKYIDFLNQTWIVIAGAIGAITLIWNFVHKTLNEIRREMTKPFTDIKEKIDNIEKKMDDSREHDAQVQRALLTMQRNSLLKSCEDYIKSGYATLEEKETISEQFISYSELGGNHFVGEMVAKIMNLPLEKPRAAKKSKKPVEKNVE